MKKFIILSLMFLFTFITTGCVKYSYNIEIDKKDNVKLSETVAFNLAAFKGIDPNFDKTMDSSLDSAKEEYESNGYKVSSYEDDNNFKGITASKNFKLKELKLKDLPEGYKSKNKMPIVVNQGFIKNTYTINLTYDINSANSKIEGEQSNTQPQNYNNTFGYSNSNDIKSKRTYVDNKTGETVEEIEYKDGSIAKTRHNKQSEEAFNKTMENMFNNMPGMMPTADLTIKIPYKATENNATKVISDYEYLWNLGDKEGIKTIELKYEKYNWAGIISIILLLIILIIAAIKYNNYLNNSNW